ncbi:MAG: YceI family protein [Caldilineaceae bacterium]
MGRDKTVVGVTSAVEGSITVDPADPSSATISPIRIDASTLATDSGQRNGAIRRWILQSNQAAYQYIVFTPTAIEGLPTTITIGEPFEFTVVGDLTIRDITKEETFKLTVTATSEAELVGLGQTTVMRSDYNLTIPNVPSVANVGEEVPLEIEFTAVTG